MTTDEAIKTFEYYQRQHDRGLPVMVTKRDIVALDMAIEALEEYDKVADALNGYTELYRKLKEKYDNLKKQNQWIPCEKRLPREDELILVNVIHPDRVYPIILCIGKDAYAMAEHGDINAWMPLPKPYEGRTE